MWNIELCIIFLVLTLHRWKLGLFILEHKLGAVVAIGYCETCQCSTVFKIWGSYFPDDCKWPEMINCASRVVSFPSVLMLVFLTRTLPSLIRLHIELNLPVWGHVEFAGPLMLTRVQHQSLLYVLHHVMRSCIGFFLPCHTTISPTVQFHWFIFCILWISAEQFHINQPCYVQNNEFVYNLMRVETHECK